MKLFRYSLFLVGTLVLGACSSDFEADDPISIPPQDDPSAIVQFVHASADAPTVTVLVDGAAPAQESTLTGIDYAQTSGLIVLSPGSHTFEVEADVPGGLVTSVLGPVTVDLAEDTFTTFTVVGSVAGDTLDIVQNELPLDSVQSVPADSVTISVTHAVPGPGGGSLPVTVWVTPPDAVLGESAPVGTFDYGESLGPVTVTAGEWQVRVTEAVAGNAIGEVIFDSGPVTLEAGVNARITALPNVSGGPSPITLLAAAAGAGENGTIGYDLDTPAWLRLGHVAAAAGPVDIFLDDGDAVIDFEGVDFPTVTPFMDFDAATYEVTIEDEDNLLQILPAGDDPIELTLGQATFTQVLAVATVAVEGEDPPAAPIDLLIASDDPRPLATAAKVRIVHAAAAEAAEEVDVYVVDSGVDIADEDPLFASWPYLSNTGYLQLDPGDYDAYVTLPESKDPVASGSFSLDAGDVYTVIARDPLPAETEFGLIVLPDGITPIIF